MVLELVYSSVNQFWITELVCNPDQFVWITMMHY